MGAQPWSIVINVDKGWCYKSEGPPEGTPQVDSSWVLISSGNGFEGLSCCFVRLNVCRWIRLAHQTPGIYVKFI